MTDSDEAYVTHAVKLAGDSAYRADLRARIVESRGMLFGDLARLDGFVESVGSSSA